MGITEEMKVWFDAKLKEELEVYKGAIQEELEAKFNLYKGEMQEDLGAKFNQCL